MKRLLLVHATGEGAPGQIFFACGCPQRTYKPLTNTISSEKLFTTNMCGMNNMCELAASKLVAETSYIALVTVSMATPSLSGFYSPGWAWIILCLGVSFKASAFWSADCFDC